MELNSELERLQKYSAIDVELQRAKTKHPNYPENMFQQLAIMQEEAGELLKQYWIIILEYVHLLILKKNLFKLLQCVCEC